MSYPLKSGHSFIRQAAIRKKQASLPAFFVPLRGQFSELFLKDLELIVKLKNNSQMISND